MNEFQIMQGIDWCGQDPTGWIVMGKFRGCRGEWDGKRLWSKGGQIIPAPRWFVADLPRRARPSGEIFAGNCKVETSARLATQFGHFERGVHRLVIFDCPLAPGGIVKRMNRARRLRGRFKTSPIEFADTDICTGLDDLAMRLQAVKAAGGEGLMIHLPGAPLRAGRVDTLLKVKQLP